jgi:hypothetical protein
MPIKWMGNSITHILVTDIKNNPGNFWSINETQAGKFENKKMLKDFLLDKDEMYGWACELDEVGRIMLSTVLAEECKYTILGEKL